MSLTANAARPAFIESLPKKPRLTKLTSALSFYIIFFNLGTIVFSILQ